VVSALISINVVNRHWARLVLGWVTVGAGKQSRHVTSHLGQLSLPSLGVGKSSTRLSGWG